jgi:hypothetical protein
MYYRPPVGKDIKDLRIQCCVRGWGVNLHGKNIGHFVFRNLHAEYVWNDGYGIAGNVKDATFLNCSASHCADEGFSSHGECETILDGGIFVDCSEGIGNVNSGGFTISRNVIIAHSHSYAGFLIHGAARNELRNAILINNPSGITASTLTLENVLIVNTPGYLSSHRPYVGVSGPVTARKLTCTGGFTTALRSDRDDKPLVLEDCLFTGGKENWHFRMDAPFAAMKLRNVMIGPGGTVTWGAKPPWQTRTFAQWFEEAVQAGVAEGVREATVDMSAAIVSGCRPEAVAADLGCDDELLERYLQYVRKQQWPDVRHAEASRKGR